MILYVYVVTGSFNKNLAVTGSGKKALDKAAEYLQPTIENPTGDLILDKATMTRLKKELKTGKPVLVTHEKTEVVATVQKFNLD